MTAEPRNICSIAPADRIQYSKAAQTDYLPELDKPQGEERVAEEAPAKKGAEPELLQDTIVSEEPKEAKLPGL